MDLNKEKALKLRGRNFCEEKKKEKEEQKIWEERERKSEREREREEVFFLCYNNLQVRERMIKIMGII